MSDVMIEARDLVKRYDDVVALVGNGRVLDAWEGEGPWAVFDRSGTLLAVYEAFRGQAKPAVVLLH